MGRHLVTHRQDTAHSGKNSLKLSDPASDTETFTELSPSVAVVGSATYRLTAFAKTSYAPADVEMRLSYLNALGESLTETGVAGDSVPLLATAWRMMSLVDTAPADAVRAVVTMRLAGATTTNTAGIGVLGSSATLDDISLSRPGAAWKSRYDFTSGMPRGTYRFKGSVSCFPGVLGTTSSVASVTLKLLPAARAAFVASWAPAWRRPLRPR